MQRQPPDPKSLAKLLIGCPILLGAVFTVGLITWLVGPFGPTIHAVWIKWVVTVVDFVVILCLLYILTTVLMGTTDWGIHIHEWLYRVEDRLVKYIEKVQEGHKSSKGGCPD